MNIKVVCLIIFLNSCLSFSQNLENLKTQDTIYVLFDGKENQQKNIYRASNGYDYQDVSYIFSNKKDRLYFNHSKYLSFDDQDIKKESITKTVSEEFVNNNKPNVVNIHFFENNGFGKSYNYLRKNHFFVIDLSEKVLGYYIAKEVSIDIVGEE